MNFTPPVSGKLQRANRIRALSSDTVRLAGDFQEQGK